jgi:hypothetical protein
LRSFGEITQASAAGLNNSRGIRRDFSRLTTLPIKTSLSS